MKGEDGEEIYRFGPFRLAAASGILEHNGARVPLTPKTFDTLLVLVRNATQVVDKERLIAEVWPETFVAESGLTRNICVLRKMLQDLDPGVDFIETIPKRGYRFINPVEREISPPRTVVRPAAGDSGCDVIAAHVGTGRPRWYTIAAALILAVATTWHGASSTQGVAAKPALRDYRLATHLMNQVTPEQARKSADLLERNIRRNPDVALAHAGLANALITEVELGADDPHAKIVKARRAAARAVELDPNLEQARIVLGLAVLLADWDWPRAEAQLRRAIALNPASAPAHQTYAHFLVKTGRIDEALRAIQKAAELDPVSPIIGAQQAHIHYCAGRFNEAVQLAEAVLDRQPGFALARYYLALSLAHLGSYERARAELERTDFRRDLIEIDCAWILARAGDVETARKVADSLPPTRGIALRAALGQVQAGLEGLELLIRQRSSDALNLMADPRLEALEATPRYQQLRMRIGLYPIVRAQP